MTVFVVGSANMDLVVSAPRLPRPGETVLGGDLVRTPGGKGANQAVAAARVGANVSFVGALGSDPFGAELTDALQTAGVDVSGVRVDSERPSGCALIVVDAAGENLIAVAPGANAALSPADAEAGLRTLAGGDVVLLQLEIPLETVRRSLELAAGAGGRVVLNAAPATPLEPDLLRHVDVLIVNAGEATALTGIDVVDEAAARLLTLGPSTVIVTLGGDGLLLVDASDSTRIPARRVTVVDTTAAGDAFCGAFAAALAAGRASREAAAFASVAAALATTRLGAQASLPSRAEVEAALVPGGTVEAGR